MADQAKLRRLLELIMYLVRGSYSIQQLSDNRWELTTEVCNMEGIGRFVMGLYDEIRIIDAPELERYLREKIKAMNGSLN